MPLRDRYYISPYFGDSAYGYGYPSRPELTPRVVPTTAAADAGPAPEYLTTPLGLLVGGFKTLATAAIGQGLPADLSGFNAAHKFSLSPATGARVVNAPVWLKYMKRDDGTVERKPGILFDFSVRDKGPDTPIKANVRIISSSDNGFEARSRKLVYGFEHAPEAAGNLPFRAQDWSRFERYFELLQQALKAPQGQSPRVQRNDRRW